jgi:hypothetical protein
MWSFVMVVALVSGARAEQPGPTIGLALAGESLQDPWIVDGYDAEGLGGAVTASLPLPVGLRLGVQLGYARRGGSTTTEEDGSAVDPSWLAYTSASLPVFYDLHAGPVTLGAGLGPAYVIFSEKADPVNEYAETGGKFGFVVEGQARLATDLLHPSMHDPDSGPIGVDVVVDAGYRKCARHLLKPAELTGLDFSGVIVHLGLELAY